MAKRELAEYIPQFVEGIEQFAAEKDIRYDLIHSHYWMSGLAAENLSDAWGGVPIVHMFHTLGEMKNRIARSDDEREGAYRIACNVADAALGLRAIAEVFGLGFVPIAAARCDLVIPDDMERHPTIKIMIDVLQSRALQKEISVLPGYDGSVTGKMIAALTPEFGRT